MLHGVDQHQRLLESAFNLVPNAESIMDSLVKIQEVVKIMEVITPFVNKVTNNETFIDNSNNSLTPTTGTNGKLNINRLLTLPKILLPGAWYLVSGTDYVEMYIVSSQGYYENQGNTEND
jgi:hypothetical protein